MPEPVEFRPPTSDPFEQALRFARNTEILDANLKLQSEAMGKPIGEVKSAHETRIGEILNQWQESLRLIEDIKSASNKKDSARALATYEQLLSLWTHPDIKHLMTNLAQEFKKNLQEIHGAFIPGGSAASFFTLFIKEALGTYPPTPENTQDLDLLMTSDYPKGGNSSKKVDDLLGLIAKQLVKTTRFRGESASNIGNYAPDPIPNIDSAEGWIGKAKSPSELLQKISQDNYFARNLLNYFVISFPPEINQRNRQIFLQELGKLPKEKSTQIIDALERVIRDENYLVAIKPKYFFGNRPVPESAKTQITKLNREFINTRAEAILPLLHSAVRE